MNLARILRPLKQTMWYKNLNLQEYIYADQDSTLISHLETHHHNPLETANQNTSLLPISITELVLTEAV